MLAWKAECVRRKNQGHTIAFFWDVDEDVVDQLRAGLTPNQFYYLFHHAT
jgi:hypothetical protein